MPEIKKTFKEIAEPVIKWMRDNKMDGNTIFITDGSGQMLSEELEEIEYFDLEEE